MVDVLVFFFDSEFNGFIDKAVLDNGSIFYENNESKYEFPVADAKPIMFNKKSLFGGLSPMYFVKWDELIPVNFEFYEKKEDILDEEIEKIRKQIMEKENTKLDKIKEKIRPEKKNLIRKSIFTPVPINMNFSGALKMKGSDGKIRTVTPEMLRSTTDMRFLKSMKEASMMTGKKAFKYKNLALALIFLASVGAFTLYGMMYLNVI